MTDQTLDEFKRRLRNCRSGEELNQTRRDYFKALSKETIPDLIERWIQLFTSCKNDPEWRAGVGKFRPYRIGEARHAQVLSTLKNSKSL